MIKEELAEHLMYIDSFFEFSDKADTIMREYIIGQDLVIEYDDCLVLTDKGYHLTKVNLILDLDDIYELGLELEAM